MKNYKYKDQNKKNYKILMVVLFVMIFILLFMTFLLKVVEKNIEENEVILSYDEIETIKDVITYHKSKYISENVSEERGFSLDVYLSFKVPLYEEDGAKSNEEYYTTLIEDCAKIIRYSSFKLIDTEHDINIKVICKNNKIEKIIINELEDYFIYMDSRYSIQNYEELPKTSLSIVSEDLQRCIDGNWNADIYFGERESIFNNYYIYFDEGINVRIIDGKIYNIIFTNKYKKDVINNIFPGMDLRSAESSLGEATFKDEDLNVIGYKNDKVYVFLTESMISVYRNSSETSDEFFDLADEYLNENLDLLEFMNELTYIWPDYSEYFYTESSFFIAYPLKGVEISVNNGDINGFLVYNNNKSTLSKIGRYLEDTNFVGRLQKDSVFEAEKRRLKADKEMVENAKEFIRNLEQEKKNLIGESLNYLMNPIKDSNGKIYQIEFISKDGEKPNREINDTIDSYLWINNDHFLFSKIGKGIYFYNLNTGKVQRVYTGIDEFIFNEYENNILRYDNTKEVELKFEEGV